MQKKRSIAVLREKLGFLGIRDGKNSKKDGEFLLEIEKTWVARNFDPLNRRWGAILN